MQAVWTQVRTARLVLNLGLKFRKLLGTGSEKVGLRWDRARQPINSRGPDSKNRTCVGSGPERPEAVGARVWSTTLVMGSARKPINSQDQDSENRACVGSRLEAPETIRRRAGLCLDPCLKLYEMLIPESQELGMCWA